jgi:ATP-dependent RNA helicase RhlE
MKFDKYNLNPIIKTNLDKLGFKRPTDIQFRAITPIMNGEDVLAIAQTGTGKTAAFAIPITDYLSKNKKKNRQIRCLVLVPTRELAIQISDVFQQIGFNTGIKIMSLFGGVEQDKQIKQLKEGIDILITTPGRMFDLISQGYIKLENLETLVLDEADHMLDLGFLKDIKDLMRHIPFRRQTLFFSATITDKIRKLAYSIVRNPIRIQISPENPVNKNIEHAVAMIEMDDKRFFLERMILENPDSKILIFVRTKVRAERVCKAMERANIVTKTIHGDKDQKERFKVLEDFRNNKTKILIATDVSARGIDIADVDYVVNYDLPDKAESYVHRVGRTGRADKKGNAVSFCSKEEKTLLKDIEAFIGAKIDLIKIDKDTYQETIDFKGSQDKAYDWQSLIDE